MWLLNTFTYQIVFVQNPAQAHYAILSHVWDSAGEQTFQVSIAHLLSSHEAQLMSPFTVCPRHPHCRTTQLSGHPRRYRHPPPRLRSSPAEFEDQMLLRLRSHSRLRVPLDRHVLYRQDQQRGALGGDQLHVHLVFAGCHLLRLPLRRLSQ